MSTHYRFGEWTVLPEHNQIRRLAEVHQLERRTMDVLVCLLNHSGEVIPLRTILDEVWEDRVVEENSVHQRIHQIRRALGDSPRSSRYIASVPRRGYRLVADVTPLPSDGNPAALAATPLIPVPLPEAAADGAEADTSRGLRAWLVALNRYVLIGSGWRAYPVLCLIGGVPLLIAPFIGIWSDRPVPGTTATCSVGLFADRCAALEPLPAGELARLVQDTAQLFVVCGWLTFLITILYIANVKLLPLRVLGETSGRVAYLREFIPPHTADDHLLDSVDPADVDRVASAFRHQHFWPIGDQRSAISDQRAADALSLCVLIFLLMLLPLVPSTGPQTVVFLVFVLASFLLARALLGIQRHLLARVDASLTRAFP